MTRRLIGASAWAVARALVALVLLVLLPPVTTERHDVWE
jgi:hypothetical protein